MFKESNKTKKREHIEWQEVANTREQGRNTQRKMKELKIKHSHM